MRWCLKAYEELTVNELYQILKERVNVFVVEQNCPYPELDEKDDRSYHLFAEEDGQIIAYSRLLPAGVNYQQASIGRVLVKETLRKTGIGYELMKRSVDFFRNERDEKEIKIQAQEYAEQFYEKFGFKRVSEVYPEDGIPHVDMIWTRT